MNILRHNAGVLIKKMKNPAVFIGSVQIALMVSLGLVGVAVFDRGFALSVMVGAGVAIGPQALFGYWVFKDKGARNARLIVRNFFIYNFLIFPKVKKRDTNRQAF